MTRNEWPDRRGSWQELASRYETPNSRNRWDNPLFEVLPTSALPIGDIEEHLYQSRAPKQNLATKPVRLP